MEVIFENVDLKKLEKIAQIFANNLTIGNVFLLYGDLGSGKTTFVKSIVKFLDPQVKVSSPTFTIVKVYNTSPKIYHIDLYRIEDPYEIHYFGIFDKNDGVYFIEWADKLEDLFEFEKEKTYFIFFEYLDISSRNLKISSFDQKVLDQLKKLKTQKF